MHGTFNEDRDASRDAAELIQLASKSALAQPSRFGGREGTRNDYERILKSAEKRIAAVARDIPRLKGEPVKAYSERVFDDSPQGRDRSKLLYLAVQATANIRRIETGRDELALLHAGNDIAVYRDRVDGLTSVVQKAIAGEAMLAELFKAMSLHKEAEKARAELLSLYGRAFAAANQLSKAAPHRPHCPSAPDEAVKFAALLHSLGR